MSMDETRGGLLGLLQLGPGLRPVFCSILLLACREVTPAPSSEAGDSERDDATDSVADAGTESDSDADTGTGPAEEGDVCANTFSIPFAAGYSPDPEVLGSVQSTMSVLTLEDKANQMRGTDPAGGQNISDIYRTPDDTENGIRGFQFRDGPRGLNLDSGLTVGHNGYSTAFPVSVARAATFDLDLEHRIGAATGDETLASQHTLLLAPTVNLLRHPAWGRAQETYGEDPFMLGRMGSAYTTGVQEHIPACVKSYIANNVENGRASLNADMDEQTLREIYGRGFEMIIRDSGVACVMAAYNLVLGTKCTENEHILNDVLRDDIGFRGFVISEWWAMSNGTSTDRLLVDYQDVAIQALRAGLDIELPWSLNYSHLESLVVEDSALGWLIDRSVARILEQKYRFNIGDMAASTFGLVTPSAGYDVNTSSIIDNQAHIDLAEEAALKGAVLLKNDDQTLPISLDSSSTVAVLSATVDVDLLLGSATVNFATDVVTGDFGSSRVNADPEESVSLLDGIMEAGARAGVDVISGTSAADAAGADFVVVVAGLTPGDEGEEYTGAGDRSSFALDAKIDGTPQADLINAAAALGKPMAVVLIGGSAIDMPWQSDVPAVLMAWYPGMVGGRAIGKLLFGEVSPGGKLPFTWPASWDDLPELNPGGTVDMGYFTGYRYFEQQGIEPLFPFGHGLSYTELVYSNLRLPCSAATADSVVRVRVDVTNQGDVSGDEVVYLFTSYPESTDERKQTKQLKGFYRVSLEPGQVESILMPLRIDDLRFFNIETDMWEIEPGTLEIMVGSSAENILLTEQLTIL
jgi:beta-glucosidase